MLVFVFPISYMFAKATSPKAVAGGLRRRMLATINLLEEAIRIEKDLWNRLSRHPGDRSLGKELSEYRELVDQLVWEQRLVLRAYVAKIRARFLKG